MLHVVSLKKHTLGLGASLLLLGLLTRVIGLGYPSQVVFDEVHFGKFVNAYCCSHEHFFDIHPPHGKLLIAAVAHLAGYDGSQPFENIGEEIKPTTPIAILRLVPALSGALLPLIIFILLRQLGAASSIAFFGGWIVVFDNALVVQSRLISLDSILLLATFGALSAYLAGIRYSDEQGERHKRKSDIFFTWITLAGVLAGLAVGIKLTGLVALGLISVLIAMRIVSKLIFAPAKSGIRSEVIAGLVILICAFIVYLAGWVMHEQLLTAPGPGDAFYARDATIWQKHDKMLSANYNLTATHPYASHWWSWPLMFRSVFYWQDEGAWLYFLGNPAVWWGAAALAVVATVTLLYGSIFNHIRRGPTIWQYKNLTILLYGFFISFVPLIRVPRALFLYHYLTPLLFIQLFGLLWLDRLIRHHESGIRLVAILCSITLLGFIVFSPLTYGLVVPRWWQVNLFWLTGWR